MSIKAIDMKTREEIRADMMQALKENNTESFYAALDAMVQRVGEDVRAEYEQQLDGMRQEMDSRILAARGVRQLTSEEHNYYQALIEAMRSPNPKQAISDIKVAMPETVINSVFEDLRANHPLLSKINFMATNGAIKLLYNTNGEERAVWGPLCGDIVKELTGGFREVDVTLCKLSAFVPVCKAMLDLGPAWLDRYVREILYEAQANGMEYGLVGGSGKDEPIGMTRQVGDSVTVTGGVYPVKAPIAVSDLSKETVGGLISLLAIGPNGKPRSVRDVILVVNPVDYFQRVMPATTLLAPDGSYRNDVLPYPMTIIQSAAVDQGRAVLGLAYRYFAAAGSAVGGKIEYSDEYQFLEDNRVYLIKTYANGLPKDNTAFQLLDISGLQPLTYKVEMVTPAAASNVATLASLSLGNAALTPAFASSTVTYEAATTNAKNTVTAIPSDAGAGVEIKLGEEIIENGSAAEWETGVNTLTVTVTAADGTTTKAYTVTVNKS